jgi:hypothetical protein
MIWLDRNESASAKQRFYSMASKAKYTDIYAKARFKAEPWHLTDLRMRKEAENAYRSNNDNGTDGV